MESKRRTSVVPARLILFDRQVRKTNQILFHTSAKLSDETLLAKLIEALGQPADSPKPGFFRWKTKDRLWVYVTGRGGFNIVGEGSVVGTGRDPEQKQ